MKKKVLIISNSAWNLYNFRINLIQYLLKSFDVFIMCPKDEYLEYLKKKGCIHYNFDFNATSRNIFSDLLLITKLYTNLKKNNYTFQNTLFFTTKVNILFPFFFKSFSKNLIINITGLGRVFEKKNIYSMFVKFFYKVNFNFVDFITFQTLYDRDFFLPDRNFDKFVIVPGSGTNTNKKCILNNSVKIKVIFVGRLLKSKGIKDYFFLANEILKKNNDVEFIVAGSHKESDNDYIDSKILNEYVEKKIITYLGFRDDIEKILEKTDICVLPTTYMEGVPFSLIQAAINSNILLAYDWRGCRDIIVDGKNGYLIDINDQKINNLILSINKILNMSSKEINDMKIYSYNHAKNSFDYKAVNNIYSKIIKK